MTDNRTNEPTPEQVEAALAAHDAHKGAWVDEFREMVCPECGWCYMTEHERRPENKPSNEVVYGRVDTHRMRAALVAAQGAAPQAESAPKSSYISPSLPSMIRNLWKSDPSENSVRTALKLAGDLIQELIDLKAAPVLSSSGVDEDALAEVKARALEEAASALEAHPDEHDLGMGYSAFMGDAGEPAWLRARAAEYLERGSE